MKPQEPMSFHLKVLPPDDEYIGRDSDEEVVVWPEEGGIRWSGPTSLLDLAKMSAVRRSWFRTEFGPGPDCDNAVEFVMLSFGRTPMSGLATIGGCRVVVFPSNSDGYWFAVKYLHDRDNKQLTLPRCRATASGDGRPLLALEGTYVHVVRVR